MIFQFVYHRKSSDGVWKWCSSFLLPYFVLFFLHQFIHQNGGFTKVWVSLKTVFFPTIVGIMAWFWRRISHLARPPLLLEYMLMVLGAALTLLNCEFEQNLGNKQKSRGKNNWEEKGTLRVIWGCLNYSLTISHPLYRAEYDILNSCMIVFMFLNRSTGVPHPGIWLSLDDCCEWHPTGALLCFTPLLLAYLHWGASHGVYWSVTAVYVLWYRYV